MDKDTNITINNYKNSVDSYKQNASKVTVDII